MLRDVQWQRVSRRKTDCVGSKSLHLARQMCQWVSTYFYIAVRKNLPVTRSTAFVRVENIHTYVELPQR